MVIDTTWRGLNVSGSRRCRSDKRQNNKNTIHGCMSRNERQREGEGEGVGRKRESEEEGNEVATGGVGARKGGSGERREAREEERETGRVGERMGGR